uniref:Uncharacterized protein n=1 Tax=Anguilla anguilla TaxID=7936 RepID=A0A0E9XYU7_ANGAN
MWTKKYSCLHHYCACAACFSCYFSNHFHFKVENEEHDLAESERQTSHRMKVSKVKNTAGRELHMTDLL